MATKERSPRKRKELKPPKPSEADEQKVVNAWRQEQFVKVLRENGLTDDDIDLTIVKELVKSNSSHHDLAKLIKKGCDPETAIRIIA